MLYIICAFQNADLPITNILPVVQLLLLGVGFYIEKPQ